ncbi:Mu Gam family protein [Thioalkalivibrio sulfidiphilus HL-EbGr7]|uniref:Mu Gam family protein n=1 Tax=Thioalkalivibrio sulfidiphilus (strain HL-EbGR7) TaxID=396588 RepID=B8GKZ7_THISH|nr:host-nuclease inhibitor Gam family protein [Thioalkalivibrio sulfidiphilus]ACL71515.1 Mu Gam family protein [Thioalkalivibrio sulfidiphilus HL-EbGr7]
MPKTERIKQKAATFVPGRREEVTEAIAEIGRLQRERSRIQAAMNDEIAAVKQRYEEQARPLAEDIQRLADGVHLWCEANRPELTQEGKRKTANLASGEVRWRMRPPSVSARGLDKIIQTLKDLRLTRFIRTKEELDKEAVLAEPDAVKHIKGISIKQSEDFVIVPFETELEEVA